MDIEQVQIIFLDGGEDHLTSRMATYEAQQAKIAHLENAKASGGANTPAFFWAAIAGAMAVGLSLAKIIWMERFGR